MLEEAGHVDGSLLLGLGDHLDHDGRGEAEDGLLRLGVDVDDVETVPAASKALLILREVCVTKSVPFLAK